MILDYRSHLGVNKEGNLTIGSIDTLELARIFGTPLYVIDEERIRERYQEFLGAFTALYPKVEIRYAYKANASLSVCHILRREGAGADALSYGDIKTALLVGLKPGQIIFTGNNKTDEELELAVDAGITINIDALHELRRLKRICSKKNKNAGVSFRINPSVSPKTHPHLATGLKESKFGIHEEEALKAYKEARDLGFRILGIHMHIGSQITEVSPYKEATVKLLDIAGNLKKELGLDLEFVDLGGGLGIRYEESKEYITPRDLAEALVPILREKIEDYGLKEPVLYLEPGRYIVGDSAVMLTRVSTIKQTPYKKFIGVDAGFSVFPRPFLYNAYHEVIVANKMKAGGEEAVDIAGDVCETGDILARDRKLPKVEEGDILAFLDAGAYCIAMASQYNLRPRPAEILVCKGEYELIRERETLDDLLAKQRVPERLKK
ncbi:MAG: diaminopimelate decarboxylase [Candidatus Hydrothermarchaeales archaeon]